MIRINKYFVLLILTFLFTKCTPLSSFPTFTGDPEITGYTGDFIELKDGSFVRGKITNYSLGEILAKGGGSVTIDTKQFGYKDVIAAQYNNKYYRKDRHKGFDERVIKGRINVYRSLEITETESEIITFDWYFLQKGDKEPIVEFELKELEKMVLDYKPALDEVKKYKVLKKGQKNLRGDKYLNNIIAVYNSQ